MTIQIFGPSAFSDMTLFSNSNPNLANSTMFFSLSPLAPVVVSSVTTPSSLATARATKSLANVRQPPYTVLSLNSPSWPFIFLNRGKRTASYSG